MVLGDRTGEPRARVDEQLHHSSASNFPPADFSFGANCTVLPARSCAPLMKLWYGHANGRP